MLLKEDVNWKQMYFAGATNNESQAVVCSVLMVEQVEIL